MKDLATRTLSSEDELRYSGMLGTYCSTNDSPPVTVK